MCCINTFINNTSFDVLAFSEGLLFVGLPPVPGFGPGPSLFNGTGAGADDSGGNVRLVGLPKL